MSPAGVEPATFGFGGQPVTCHFLTRHPAISQGKRRLLGFGEPSRPIQQSPYFTGLSIIYHYFSDTSLTKSQIASTACHSGAEQPQATYKLSSWSLDVNCRVPECTCEKSFNDFVNSIDTSVDVTDAEAEDNSFRELRCRELSSSSHVCDFVTRNSWSPCARASTTSVEAEILAMTVVAEGRFAILRSQSVHRQFWPIIARSKSSATFILT
jgi:hypothetical protein